MASAYSDPASLLRSHGLRATNGRVELIKILEGERQPVTIEYLRKKLRNTLNEVTLYRALEALAAEHIVTRSDLGHGHVHYELALGRPHHHHAVCRDCGYVEDIEVSHAQEPAIEARNRSKGFKLIDAYSFEFFGLCKACA